nr:sex-lethal homolog [Arachis hypogaea]
MRDRSRKDPRIWNHEAYQRLEYDSFSVFVDNLPEDISKRELYHLFCWTGRINNIYLCRKWKSGIIYLFAFARYTTKGGALKAIAEMNQWRLRGKVITVREAKFRRQVGKRDQQVNIKRSCKQGEGQRKLIVGKRWLLTQEP